jgi:hypothetical protein
MDRLFEFTILHISSRLTNVYVLYIYLGFNVLCVEYRGYGKSGGTPSEQGKLSSRHITSKCSREIGPYIPPFFMEFYKVSVEL